MSQTVDRQTEPTDKGKRQLVSGESQSAESQRMKQLVSVPRWVVYFQAALLGIVATTFFVFGMMVGSLTSGSSDQVNLTFDCRILGSVVYRVDGNLRADEGAVVFLLPVNEKPDERAPGKLVNPETFKALDNSAIERIHALGGTVVRADQNGQFDIVVDAKDGNGLEYYLLIVSKNVRGVDTEPMTKEQVASIGTFFIPVEDVVEDRSFYWLKLAADSDRIDLPEIEF
jgi:hypothetical protein